MNSERSQFKRIDVFSFICRPALSLAALSLFLSACSEEPEGSGSNGSKPVAPYCNTKATFASDSPITVTGTAKFEYRIKGNGPVTTNPEPIKYAEVRVTDSSGNIIQCSETDENGEFSFPLPGNGAAYTVSVLSRSNNEHNTAYILNNPTDNKEYELSKTITASGSPHVDLLAKATGDLKGGAFNILDQIYKAQKFLREETKDCDQSGSPTYYPDCVPFTTAPVANIYWSPGVSPGIYVGVDGPISFYLSGTNSLYILGGENGDTQYSDMDHFDNSVIIHEYAHFIEDIFGKPDSPGGSHDADSIIDPRLAWSEGFANYFQAAVLGIDYYLDTSGHVGCGTNCKSEIKLKLDPNPSDTYNDKPREDGEGNFREFSVARLLYDVTKNGGASQFSEIWTILRGPSNGFYGISDRFKSIGRFHVIQRSLSGDSSWSTLRTTEKQTGNLANFATPLKVCDGDPSQHMAIMRCSGDSGSFSTSNLLRNNDFFVYDHPGGPLSVSLTWRTWQTYHKADLDLYIYKEGYYFGDSSTMAAKSDTASDSNSGSESINTVLPAGTYMINVMAYTGIYQTPNVTHDTSYKLQLNGTYYCPDPGSDPDASP